MDKITVILADDHAILRSGLRLLLSAEPDIEVVGEAATGTQTLALVRQLKPAMVLLDLSMPENNGLAILPRIKEESPHTKVLVLTMHDDLVYLRQVFELGGDGYILKKAADRELLSAIRTVHRGVPFADPSVAGLLVKQIFHDKAATATSNKQHPLSQREMEVLKLVAAGYTNQEIAERLVISVKTVENHKAHIKEKLGLKGRSELVRYCLEHRLLQ